MTALVMTGCAGDGGDAGEGGDGTVEITAGVAASQSSTALLLGVEQGFFEEEGLDVTIDYSATGSGAISQLINGQMHVALGAVSPAISAVAEGIPVQIVSGSVNDREDPAGTQYQTMVAGDSDIETFSDLEGKTVAVNSLSCCWEFWLREAVEKDGGDPDAVQLVQLPFADAVTALRQGEVDAISTAQPFATSLRQDGFRDIGDSAAVAFDNPEAGFTVFYMSEQFIADNPGIVERWRAALERSSEYANEHPEETRAQIVEQTGVDAELMESAPLPLYSAEIDVASVEAEAGFLEKYGVLDSAPEIDEIVAP
ncbi:ABC transporter substrate-binding protein [Pseudoclavibacter endophyticus]|uniref:ABC transporter substrate-binding protein n=1 Tax=Pseudoclavibacter endophyticus TaxID=1778590 RepID=UPI001662E862|nr:ABC transporter substrate-binding protein [Pseudoclavibacter endophyticus]